MKTKNPINTLSLSIKATFPLLAIISNNGFASNRVQSVSQVHLKNKLKPAVYVIQTESLSMQSKTSSFGAFSFNKNKSECSIPKIAELKALNYLKGNGLLTSNIKMNKAKISGDLVSTSGRVNFLHPLEDHTNSMKTDIVCTDTNKYTLFSYKTSAGVTTQCLANIGTGGTVGNNNPAGCQNLHDNCMNGNSNHTHASGPLPVELQEFKIE